MRRIEAVKIYEIAEDTESRVVAINDHEDKLNGN